MEQKLSFKNLYTRSREEIKETLVSMWTGGPTGSNGYEEDMGKAVNEMFAPQNPMPIVVQSMFSWKHIGDIDSLTGEEKENAINEAKEKARKLVKWEETYAPFKHQYECWDKLLNQKKSICVTTGTGSGKTECFMLPIIKEISKTKSKQGVRAIFLYPLNALAEDQKSRLNKYLEQVDPDNEIKFAVYNGNTKESMGDDGTINDGTLGSTDKGEKYNHELTTRNEIRKNPPAILVTNPTMLEYIMLRDKDANLLGDGLEWFVIDETHTFKGAAAAELAMLIRRVLLACDIDDPKKVRFATSSATTGTGGDEELKKFIADISWRTPGDIEIISGERTHEEGKLTYRDELKVDLDGNQSISIPRERQEEIAKGLLEKDFVSIDELITEGVTAEDKLACLDKLCEDVGIRAKALYFFQAPSQGLSTRLDALTPEGKFQIINKHKSDDGKAPYVELVRCKKCGALLAQAQVEESKGDEGDDVKEYKRRKIEKTESFDIVSDTDDNQDDDDDGTAEVGGNGKRMFKTWLFAPAKDGHGTCRASLNKLHLGAEGSEGFSLRHSAKMECPCCHNAVIREKDVQTNEAHDDGDVKATNLLPLRVGSMFLSRTLSRTFLEQMTEAGEKKQTKPHNGQQYISFVDNRQGAAKLTLDQAKDIEEQWLQSRVFKILSNLGLTPSEEREYESLKEIDEDDLTEAQETRKMLLKKKKKNKGYLLWNDLFDAIYTYNYHEECKQLAKQSLSDKEKDAKSESDNLRYIMTLMYEQLGSRKRDKDSLETLGIVQTHYPCLDNLANDIAGKHVFSDFSNKYSGGNIKSEDWVNFVRIYIDYNLRSDASVYFQRTKDSTSPWYSVCAKGFRRFATKLASRRPAQPLSSSVKGRFVKLLCAASPSLNIKGLNDDQRNDINAVLKAVFDLLVEKQILEKNTLYYDSESKSWKTEEDNKKDKKVPYRINLDKIAFKLNDKAFLCPVTKRIIPYTFMGYSPYIDKNQQQAEEIANWPKFDFDILASGTSLEEWQDIVKNWCKDHRKELGIISNRTARLFLPNLPIFVSAEHTAQVDKARLEEHQKEFKEQQINILTCSTTMEMGVDLGSLELVVMNSIPPHPANYKQRAGRSGRNSQNKSAAITFCGNDSLGKMTMADAMQNIINRPYSVPRVDFESRQIIQRHVNSFLLRECGVIKSLSNDVMGLFYDNKNPYTPNDNGFDGQKIIYLHKREQGKDMYLLPGNGLNKEKDCDFDRFKAALENNNELSQRVKDRLLKGLPDSVLNGVGADKTVDMLDGLYKELESQFDFLQGEWSKLVTQYNCNKYDPRLELLDKKKAPNQSGWARRLNYKFIELLQQPLLEYLSTHQFTPNAAMPVCIVEFDTQNFGKWSKTRRPSYTLNRALSQYAPGKLVVLNNICYRSAGVDWKNRFSNSANSFESVVERGDKLQILDGSSPRQQGDITYTLIRPTAFKVDVNVDDNRIADEDIYTRTEAFLVHSDSKIKTASSLLEIYTSQEGATPEILFINTGKNRMGFCFCPNCGRADIETSWANNGVPTPPPGSFYFSEDGEVLTKKNSKTGILEPYHNHISSDKPCLNGENHSGLKRNVVFGDTIQTDYCELKLFHASTGINPKAFTPDSITHNEDYQVLHTLGMLICDDMSKNLGIERGEIDYLLTTSGTLCIYDLAKGGAGYSRKLTHEQELLDCLNRIRKNITHINEHGEYTYTSDDMINNFTIRNEEYINLPDTRHWLIEEECHREQIPDPIKALDANATYSEGLKAHLRDTLKEGGSVTLFADWFSLDNKGYEAFKENNQRWYKECQVVNKPSMCFINYDNSKSPSFELLSMCKERTNLKKTTSRTAIPNGIYPVALVNGKMYLSDDSRAIELNALWGNAHVYCIEGNKVSLQEDDLTIVQPDSSTINKFVLKQGLDIRSSMLLETLVSEDKKGIISGFFERHQNEDVDVVYEDQYLLSPFALSIAVQVIKKVISKCNAANFTVSIEMESFENNGNTGGMMRNLRNSTERDYYLESVCNGLDWGDFIKTYPDKSLPHWRLLTITSNNETLEIYPNGGFANGWYFSSNSRTRYAAYNLTHDDDMQIELQEDIMFDIQLIKHNE